MSLGIWQILLIVLLVLLLFGAGKLPSVMGDLAKGVKNFKKGLDEDDEDEKPSKSKKKTSKPDSK
jgi:sec-independent protein translocase protein TatA